MRVLDLTNQLASPTKAPAALQQLGSLQRNTITKASAIAQHALKRCVHFCKQAIAADEISQVSVVFKFIHKANDNDNWLKCATKIVLPELYDMFGDILRGSDPGIIVPCNPGAHFVLPEAVQEDETVLHTLSDMFDLCIDFCDHPKQETSDHLQSFVTAAASVLFACQFDEERVTLNALDYAMDELARNAGIVLCHLFTTFPTLIGLGLRMFRTQTAGLIALLRNAPEFSIRRSLIVILRLLYQHESEDSSSRSLRFRIEKGLSGAHFGGGIALEVFKSLDLSTDGIGTRADDVLEKLFETCGIETSCFKMADCKVQMEGRVNGSKQGGRPQKATIDWNKNSVVVRTNAVVPAYFPIHEIVRMKWLPLHKAVLLTFKSESESDVTKVKIELKRCIDRGIVGKALESRIAKVVGLVEGEAGDYHVGPERKASRTLLAASETEETSSEGSKATDRHSADRHDETGSENNEEEVVREDGGGDCILDDVDAGRGDQVVGDGAKENMCVGENDAEVDERGGWDHVQVDRGSAQGLEDVQDAQDSPENERDSDQQSVENSLGYKDVGSKEKKSHGKESESNGTSEDGGENRLSDAAAESIFSRIPPDGLCHQQPNDSSESGAAMTKTRKPLSPLESKDSSDGNNSFPPPTVANDSSQEKTQDESGIDDDAERMDVSESDSSWGEAEGSGPGDQKKGRPVDETDEEVVEPTPPPQKPKRVTGRKPKVMARKIQSGNKSVPLGEGEANDDLGFQREDEEMRQKLLAQVRAVMKMREERSSKLVNDARVRIAKLREAQTVEDLKHRRRFVGMIQKLRTTQMERIAKYKASRGRELREARERVEAVKKKLLLCHRKIQSARLESDHDIEQAKEMMADVRAALEKDLKGLVKKCGEDAESKIDDSMFQGLAKLLGD